MSVRPQIMWNDLFAILRDGFYVTSDESVEDWLERERFTDEALVCVTRFLVETWRDSKTGDHPEVLALVAFSAGWDAHRDLRGEREV